ncbi:trypsin-like serine protease with C-terminal PDZ domain containing protein [Acidovorax sp. CF316]|uniref:S1C family serine protease n=1 Tax=Acidovorax sp. CF316 TaxID=1144317 RepID=UPI00026BD728|nr:trypsin-like peptidase domain-containing protein [Acidovorax sp. CF316]EJE53287.1 trypsin-like serine protease with C-terminal PDZ domain containing protein [Acidovorax sp. CF316]
MPRPTVYSSSRPARRPSGAAAPSSAVPEPAASAAAPAPGQPAGRPQAVTLSRRNLYALWAAVLLLAALLLTSVWQSQRTVPRKLTQEDIDKAVLRTLETTTLPSAAARAVETIAPSVVRVVGFGRSKNGKDEVERGVGTGVVIVDKGVILTNLHVVQGSDRIQLTFHDGLQTTATITGVQPENDLAVLQAHKVPDDLEAASLRSTNDLRPGDQVAVVGFPFGIGPSASAGVISGLGRQFTSPEGKRELGNLIQFDAAANPGNSGGPLVTMDGEVVGIVTAILNPTPARTFIGIGFAVPIENAASAVGMSPF